MLICFKGFFGSLFSFFKNLDILPGLKTGDSPSGTLMPERENVPGRVHIAVVSDTALTASPFPYSQPIYALRTTK